jgi:hypothetical protein
VRTAISPMRSATPTRSQYARRLTPRESMVWDLQG